MARYIGEADRTQTALFPESLDEWIDEDSTVRVIDVFINELDLHALGFERAEPADLAPEKRSSCLMVKSE